MNRHDDELEHIHRVQYSTRERLAGLFVIVAAVLLLVAFVFSRQLTYLFVDTFTLHAEIETARNVSRDTPVQMAGFDIGHVREIEWSDDGKVRLTLEIREKFHERIRADSVATLSPALLGNATLQISRGNPQAPLLPDGSSIPVETPASLEDLMTMAAPAIAEATATIERVHDIVAAIDPDSVAQTTKELARTLAEVRRLVDGIESGQGTVGRLFKDEALADSIAASARELTGVLAETEQRLKDLGPVLKEADGVVAALPPLIEESADLAGTLSTQLENVNVGAALAEILLQLQSVLNETERTLRGIQNVWPIAPNMPEARDSEALPPQPPEN